MKFSSIVAITVFLVILFSMLFYDPSSEENSQSNFDKVSVRKVKQFFAFNRSDAPSYVDYDKDVKLTARKPALSTFNSSRITSANEPTVLAQSATLTFLPTSSSAAEVGRQTTLQRNQSCRETLDLKCDMYPYVKFWNRRLYPEDCYKSPLMHPLGLLGPVEEQKYVVFQPDGGGWNNIRMAAEVAMIFAHVTGRYFFLRI